MKTSTIVILSLLGLFALIGIGGYTSVVSADENANQKFGDIEAQLQRRYDLIPNLVKSVQGYANHEKDVLTQITTARSGWANAKTSNEKVEASNQLQSSLARLLVVSENYPQLKADANFRAFQDELSGSENRIAVSRRDYNAAVAEVNKKVRSPFTALQASIAGVERRSPFQANANAGTAPEVNFTR